MLHAEDLAGLQSGDVELLVPAASKVKLPPRKDPAPRHLDGSAIWARLQNQAPDRKYVYVYKNDQDAMSHYELAGYELERLRPGGVRPMGGRTCKEGEPIEMRGMLLMSVDRQRHAEIEMFGVDGGGGQAEADRIEKMIVDRRGFDPLRGMHASFMSVQNEIEAPENEVSLP